MTQSMNAPRPLFVAYPELEDTLPWTAIGTLPTPVLALPELATELGLASLTFKRDDLSAATYGGNKIRKLEFLLADAVSQGCTAVLTYGGLGSNHALATAIYCQQFDLPCTALLTPEPITPAVRKTLAYHQQLGTHLVLAADYAQLSTLAAEVRSELGGNACYEIPFGGSSWVGTVGFVNAALELAQQIRAGELPLPDVIYAACGTAGTIAGLALGLRLAGLDTRVEGIQVTPHSLRPAELAEQLYTATANELRQRCSAIPEVPEQRYMRVRDDQLGAGYAAPTTAGRAAQAQMEAATGLPFSLTYTAKGMAALLADAADGTLNKANALFWNTYNSRPYPKFAAPAQLPLPDDLQALLDKVD